MWLALPTWTEKQGAASSSFYITKTMDVLGRQEKVAVGDCQRRPPLDVWVRSEVVTEGLIEKMPFMMSPERWYFEEEIAACEWKELEALEELNEGKMDGLAQINESACKVRLGKFVAF